MERYSLFYWKRRFLLRLALLLVILTGLFGLARASGQNVGPAAVHPASGGYLATTPEPLVGDFNPISVANPSGGPRVDHPSAPAAGALTYWDYTQIEQAARKKLKNALAVREALSPYQDKVSFQSYVRKFDANAGWDPNNSSATWTEKNGWSVTYEGTGKTLKDIVDGAVKDMIAARDMYAYLAVFGPGYRFRADSAVYPDGTQYTALCSPYSSEDPAYAGSLNAENPNPKPDKEEYDGQVMAPVIDWCNFPARLRQSVREAANLRMIFGQEFMVEALGMHFSGTEFFGGENAVRAEMAQLDAARKQYVLAQQELLGAMGRVIGNGCYVSDYYTQAEWSLFSRAMENQATAQHHYAMRESYMGTASSGGKDDATTNAMKRYRDAASQGYVNLAGAAALASLTPGQGCAVKGARMDGSLLVSLSLNLAAARQSALEMREGRNVFGFDVTFTPAQPYKTNATGDVGLYNKAVSLAENARVLQIVEENNTRIFDEKQAVLQEKVDKIRTDIDGEVGERSGCHRDEFPQDDTGEQLWASCVEDTVTALNACKAILDSRPAIPPADDATALANFKIAVSQKDAAFNNCMGSSKIRPGGAERSLRDTWSAYLDYTGIWIKARNIYERVNYSNERNATVRSSLTSKGIAQTAANTASALMAMTSCFDPSKWWLNIACGVAGGASIGTQVWAGIASMNADIDMENAENLKETRNLLLDESELVIEAYSSTQQFKSKESEYKSYLGELEWSFSEAKRYRAYFQNSPANDPSFRMVRDSSRMQLAKALERAARMSYLAARRMEYEYGASLAKSNFRISDIYRARTAYDITQFLARLDAIAITLPGAGSDVDTKDLNISVAQHVLLLTDEALAKEGFTGAAAQAERVKRLRAWAAKAIDPKDGKLKFSFTLAPQDGGGLSQVIRQDYDNYWLIKLSGIADPKAGSNGVAINLVTEQTGLDFRSVTLTQGGLVNMRSFAGCTFDYKLMAPSFMLGQEWPSNQDSSERTATWNANVNKGHPATENGYRTTRFLGRSPMSTDWRVVLSPGAPAPGLPALDINKLTDIELIFSISYVSRSPGAPTLADCTRIDW